MTKSWDGVLRNGTDGAVFRLLTILAKVLMSVNPALRA